MVYVHQSDTFFRIQVQALALEVRIAIAGYAMGSDSDWVLNTRMHRNVLFRSNIDLIPS